MVEEDDRVSSVENSCDNEAHADKTRIVISTEDTFIKTGDTENNSSHAKIELGNAFADTKEVLCCSFKSKLSFKYK